MEAVYQCGGTSPKTAAEAPLVLDRPHVVSLKVAPESVLKFERRGDDLVLALRDGQEVAVRRGAEAAAPSARHRVRLPLQVPDDAIRQLPRGPVQDHVRRQPARAQGRVAPSAMPGSGAAMNCEMALVHSTSFTTA